MPREVWKEVENRKTDEARIAEAEKERGKRRVEKTDNQLRDSNSKNSGRERRGKR